MLDILLARWKQGHRTIPYPAQPPTLPDRFRGLPVVDTSKCPDGCRACAEACPTDAIAIGDSDPASFRIDLGRCLFCTDCVEACPEGAIRYSQEYRLAARQRKDLIYDGRTLIGSQGLGREDARTLRPVAQTPPGERRRVRRLRGRPERARHRRFRPGSVRHPVCGFAATRRRDGGDRPGEREHAPGAAGHLCRHPRAEIVIAVGAEAISGGIFRGHPEVHDGCGALLPVDLFIPGWPPHPMTILDGLLRFSGGWKRQVRPATGKYKAVTREGEAASFSLSFCEEAGVHLPMTPLCGQAVGTLLSQIVPCRDTRGRNRSGV